MEPHTQRAKKNQKESSKDKDRSIELNSSFLFHNGVNDVIDNIEMITIQAVTYTSLKDLLPTSTSPNSMGIVSPPNHNPVGSWYECEIPIKNPLVKHAALAYLQPMSTPSGSVGDRGGFFLDLGHKYCGTCGHCGCLSWVNDVVLKGLRGVFSSWSCEDNDYDDHDHDHGEDDKVE